MSEELIDRTPPHNLEAERAVIGAMMLDRDVIIRVRETIDHRHLYVPNHQIIFKTILDLYTQNLPADVLTVSDFLQRENVLQNIGGPKYLIELTESIATLQNAEYYAKIIEEKYIRRELIRVSKEIQSLAHDEAEIAKILDEAEQGIFAIGQKRFSRDLAHIKELLVDNFEKIAEEDEFAKNNPNISLHTGTTTGIEEMDKFLNGLNPSDLIILAARPAMGKTSFALNLAANVAIKAKLPVAIFSLEMSKEQITQRILSFTSEISVYHLKTATVKKESWSKIAQTMGKLYDAPIYIDDTSNITPIEIRAKLRRLKAEHKKLGCVVIDYLQLMEMGKSENRTQEISRITRNVKLLAKELDVPVIALSQLSRGVEQRQNKRPQLSDLRESGSIEQDSDIVMFIYRDEYYDPNSEKKNIAEIIVAKHRNGPTGTIELFFEPSLTKFASLQDHVT